MKELWGKIAASVGATALIAVIAFFFSVRDQLNTLKAQAPLRDEVLDLRLEQIRLGITINTNDVMANREQLEELDERLNDLEDSL